MGPHLLTLSLPYSEESSGGKQPSAWQICRLTNRNHPSARRSSSRQFWFSRSSPSPLGRQQMRKLHVYAGEEHPHQAQNPEVLDIGAMNPKNIRRA